MIISKQQIKGDKYFINSITSDYIILKEIDNILVFINNLTI